MAKIEQTLAEAITEGIEAGEVPAAPPGINALRAGSGTTPSTHYSPGSSASGGEFVGQHEGGGTRPLAGDYVAPTGGAEDAAVEQDRADAFAAVVAQVRTDRADAEESFRRFCKGPVEPTGYVSGLEHLQSLQDQERTRKGPRHEQ